jgi:hypothetical protein
VGAPAGGSQTITATPANDYAVGNWHLDGAVVPANGPSLTLSNITYEHTVLANFVASNDLAVTIAEFPDADGPTVTFSANSYVINIVNLGLNLLTGISMSNNLPATVSFVSAVSTQGSVSNSGGVVTAGIGSLSPGTSATITINFQTSTAGSVTDTVSVACSQSEPNLANNTATDVTFVYDPVIITNQPASQTVQVGGNAFFSVGVSGTPPFSYQWFFNGVLIDNATNPALTLTGVTAAQAGSYSVSVYQMPAPEDIMEADSDPAILTTTVWSPVPPTLISPGATTADGAPTLTNLTPTFYWSAASQAASSDLIITKYPYGSGNIVATFGVGTTSSYQLPGGILQPGTAYAWYMVSFNSLGDESAASTSLYFWTPSAPTVTTLAATNIFSNRATLQGFVNPGGAAATAYFEYGTTTNYGSMTNPTGIGTIPQNFNANITGLTSGTVYHCRIDGTNSAGTSLGLDKTFNTP